MWPLLGPSLGNRIVPNRWARLRTSSLALRSPLICSLISGNLGARRFIRMAESHTVLIPLALFRDPLHNCTSVRARLKRLAEQERQSYLTLQALIYMCSSFVRIQIIVLTRFWSSGATTTRRRPLSSPPTLFASLTALLSAHRTEESSFGMFTMVIFNR